MLLISLKYDVQCFKHFVFMFLDVEKVIKNNKIGIPLVNNCESLLSKT